MTDRTQDQAAGRRHRADDGRNERIAHFVLPVERRRRRVILAVTLTALIVLLPCPAVAELSPAIQADLYLVQAEDYRQQKDYAAAQEAMGKILELQKEHDLTLPPVFHFKYAQVLDLAESYDEAIAQLHQYLELAGALGKHYREALTLLHEVTKAAAAKQASEEEEAAAFARAQSAGTAAAYGIYLRKYTNGRHVAGGAEPASGCRGRRGVCASEVYGNGASVRDVPQHVPERAACGGGAAAASGGASRRNREVPGRDAVSVQRMPRDGRSTGGNVHDGVAGIRSGAGQ